MVLIKGKNNTNAKHAFTMRRNYRYNGFQIKGYPLAIDMWYEKPYYGRTNHDGDAVYLSEQFLSPIQNTGDKTIQAVNFVVDAFHALVKEWRAVKNTRSRKKGFFSEITAVKAWPAPGVHSMYRLYEETLYNTFIKPSRPHTLDLVTIYVVLGEIYVYFHHFALRTQSFIKVS